MIALTHPLSLRPGVSIDQPERISDCLGVFENHGIAIEEASRQATVEELVRVHSKRYVDELMIFGQSGQVANLDPELVLDSQGVEAALWAAGALLEATERSLGGQDCWVLSRPGSHHAGSDFALGFCILNNLCIGALGALKAGCHRVAIIDFDAHHGNGTEEIAAGRNNLLVASLHQHPFFPGTGAIGYDNIINLPQPAGSILAERDIAFIVEQLARFDPDIIFVEAGLDAHYLDKTSDLVWNEMSFACWGRALAQMGVPLVYELGGGYDSEARRLALDALLGGMADGRS